MNTINVENCKTLLIGRRGENAVTTVAFDFTEWASEFGSGVVDLYVKRFGDNSAYPVALTIDGTVASWLVTETDTNVAGYGKAEYVYRVDGKIAKSAVFPFFVAEDIGQPASEPPDPYESWLEQLTALGAETEAHAQAAEQSAENAADSAEDAAQSATSAEGYAGQAETAAGLAQAAQTASEAARDDAQTAQASAESSATAASGSATSAAGSATAAAGSASDASASATAAGASATAAGNAATQAEAAKTAAQAAQSAAEDAAEDAQQAAQQAHVEYEQLSGEVDDLSDEVAQQKSAIEDLQALTNRKAGMLVDSASGSIASFVPDATIDNLLGVTVDIDSVQEGEGDPSPENVRPFIRQTKASVYDEPHNSLFPGLVQWNQLVTNGDFSDGTTNRTRSTYATLSVANNTLTLGTSNDSNRTYSVTQSLNTIAGHVYYATAKIRRELGSIITGSPRTGYMLRIGNQTIESLTLENVGDEGVISKVFLAQEKTNINVAKDACRPNAGDAILSVRDVMLVDLTEAFGAGKEPTAEEFRTLFPDAYYAYNAGGNYVTVSAVNGDSYNSTAIDFPASAGTVYGGTLDVTNGKLYVSPHFDSYNGEALVGPWLSSMDVYAEGTTPTAGAEVVDMGGTPTVYDLDPVTISTISGQTNNVWADTGGVSVEYAADIKSYIDRMNQPTEDDMIANSLIAANKYFTVNNKLYLSTASIAAGAQIIPGTNCTETSLVEALNALNA